MAFVVIFLQELIQGKGVIEGVRQGDALNLAFAGVTFVAVAGLTAILALQGDDDYVSKNTDRWVMPRFVCNHHWNSTAELKKILSAV